MSSSVSGNVAGYKGIYNFYNIGANSGANAVKNGLKWASTGTVTPDRGIIDIVLFTAEPATSESSISMSARIRCICRSLSNSDEEVRSSIYGKH